MNDITKDWLEQKISGIKMSATTSIKGPNKKDDDGNFERDADDKIVSEWESIPGTITIDYTGLTLQEIFNRAVAADRITWGNRSRDEGQAYCQNKDNWTINAKEYFAPRPRSAKSIDQQLGGMNADQLKELAAKIKALI